MRGTGGLLVAGWLIMVSVAFADGTIKATVGEQQTTFPAGYHGLNYFPDEPIAFLSKQPFRCLLVAGNCTYLMQGRTAESAVPVRKVLVPGSRTSFDNGYAGITSVYRDKKTRKLIGLYHAEDHVGLPPAKDNPDVHGAYWSIGLVVSYDNGNTFHKLGRVLRSSVTKKHMTRDMQGIGDVSMVGDPTGTYLYAYYTDLTRRPGHEAATI